MNELNTTLLLKVIKNKSSILRLRHQQLSFKQIADLTEEAVLNGLLDYVNNQIRLTVKGEEFLEVHFDATKKRNKSEWIVLDLENKIKSFPKNEVFLPNRSELSF